MFEVIVLVCLQGATCVPLIEKSNAQYPSYERCLVAAKGRKTTMSKSKLAKAAIIKYGCLKSLDAGQKV